jgi:quercetin dioxygenase-like cupin family protein
MRTGLMLLLVSRAVAGQDPYGVAGDHYHLMFENAWVRAARVTYGPHETAPVHQHPSTPTTVYIYVTDGGVMRFNHVTGERVAGLAINRKPVKAGAIRFAHGAAETHSVEYLGDAPTEYARIELRTEALDRPTRDVRLPPASFDHSGSRAITQFENGQVRIVRLLCAAGERCPESTHPKDPAVVVTMSGPDRGRIEWSPASAVGPVELVRIELKTKPVSGSS